MSGSAHFLDGGGEMAEAIRAHDWSSTELGPIDSWPAALKTVVGLALNSKFPKAVVWGPDLTALYNDAFRLILRGKSFSLGTSYRAMWSEAWEELGPIASRAYAGEATFIENFPLVINRFGYPEQAYFTFCYSPIRDESGAVRGMMDTVIETTGMVEAQQQARLLNHELEHRIKNVLAVISAIINQTLRATTSDAEARDALVQRIGALGKAQAALTRSSMAEADIHEVVEEGLAPFRDAEERIRVSGPPVMLSSRQALTLVLALNELATNALKYGALSNATGIVHLAWQTGQPGTDDPFRLTWTETGGPPVEISRRKGFGSRIIERVLGNDFSGEAVLIPDPAGMRCELTTRMIFLGGDHG